MKKITSRIALVLVVAILSTFCVPAFAATMPYGYSSSLIQKTEFMRLLDNLETPLIKCVEAINKAEARGEWTFTLGASAAIYGTSALLAAGEIGEYINEGNELTEEETEYLYNFLLMFGVDVQDYMDLFDAYEALIEAITSRLP